MQGRRTGVWGGGQAQYAWEGWGKGGRGWRAREKEGHVRLKASCSCPLTRSLHLLTRSSLSFPLALSILPDTRTSHAYLPVAHSYLPVAHSYVTYAHLPVAHSYLPVAHSSLCHTPPSDITLTLNTPPPIPPLEHTGFSWRAIPERRYSGTGWYWILVSACPSTVGRRSRALLF